MNYLAVVRLTGSTFFTYEKALIVRQPPIDTPDKLWFRFKMQPKQCCNSSSKGESEINLQFEKSHYDPTETAKVIVHIDNSRCAMPLKKLKFII